MPLLFDYWPYPISEYKLKQTAHNMGISLRAAIRMKLRYAVEAAGIWADILEPVYWRWIDEIVKLRRMESRIGMKLPKNAITDEMVAQARAVPITEVVTFDRGKALAWCHEDNRPSLTHMKKTNKAWCAACGIYHDPIGVMMSRDGMTFHSAVRYLTT